MKFPDGVVIWSSILPEIYFLHLYKELQVHCSVSYAYGKLITFTAGDKMRLNLWEMFQKNLIRKNPLVPFLLNTLFRLLCSSYTVTLFVHPPPIRSSVLPSVNTRLSFINSLLHAKVEILIRRYQYFNCIFLFYLYFY